MNANNKNKSLSVKQSLRLWLLRNDKGEMPFLEEWQWLEKGLKKKDIHLRKYCIQSGNRGLFSSPQEMLAWIKTGTIPRCCLKADKNEVLHKTEP